MRLAFLGSHEQLLLTYTQRSYLWWLLNDWGIIRPAPTCRVDEPNSAQVNLIGNPSHDNNNDDKKNERDNNVSTTSCPPPPDDYEYPSVVIEITQSTSKPEPLHKTTQPSIFKSVEVENGQCGCCLAFQLGKLPHYQLYPPLSSSTLCDHSRDTTRLVCQRRR